MPQTTPPAPTNYTRTPRNIGRSGQAHARRHGIGRIEGHEQRMRGRAPEVRVHSPAIPLRALAREPYSRDLRKTEHALGLRRKHGRAANLAIQQPTGRKAGIPDDLRIEA